MEKYKLEMYRLLVQDIIQTFNGRDDSVKEWIEEQVNSIEDDEDDEQ